jgi:hypothetical protein
LTSEVAFLLKTTAGVGRPDASSWLAVYLKTLLELMSDTQSEPAASNASAVDDPVQPILRPVFGSSCGELAAIVAHNRPV